MIKNIFPADIRKLNIQALTELAQDIRKRIIDVTLHRGGHLAPSLGVVELTLALHYVFNTPNDKIIWDVGHQSYAHKLITGRWDKFDTLRTENGVAGFPKRAESEYDVFDTGHSGSSISVALGITSAAKLRGVNHKSIAVIGDGSIVTGMAFEALNYAGDCHQNLIVVLNDNEMSIGKSTGAMAKYFSRMITGRMYNRLKSDTWNLLGMLPKRLSNRARFAARKIEEGLKNLIAPSIIFEEMGFRYLGPFDGHDLQLLIDTFNRVKNLNGPVLVHVVTKKGKGYLPAEQNPEVYHGVSPSQTERRKDKQNKTSVDNIKTSNSDVFGKTLVNLAEKDSRICAISAGMCLGTGLAEFKNKFPERFFDVGICEQHAVTFAAGLALQGLKPYVAIYSTFIARAYDQIIQDVALQNLPVVFALDRAGIVGEDGPTHHGSFDISFLRSIPNLTITAPKDALEFVQMLEFSAQFNRPFVIRYPRGYSPQINGHFDCQKIEFGRSEIILQTNPDCKNKIIVLAIGSMVYNSFQAIQSLVASGHVNNNNIILVNMRFIKPLDEKLLLELVKTGDTVITVEENVLSGGFGSSVMEFLDIHEIKPKQILRIGLTEKFIEQGKREDLLDRYGLSVLKLEYMIEQIVQQETTTEK
ncbi:MAG: 1-deoxy-D-xylulose-5-phosphate synthase [Candidatus Latescibacteria bacterium]|nr:1-deoxy-D-xylulose-5-phosphate synthase [Candidatus Latescibacterota bacterium]